MMDLKQPKVFRILPPAVEGGKIVLRYAFDDIYSFTETYAAETPLAVPEGARGVAFEAALRGLAVCAGISYYKAFCPPGIRVEGWDLRPAEADFYSDFYAHGLGEFAARGGHDLKQLTDKVRFVATAPEADKPAPAAGLKARSLVMVGGGKDSLVTVEALRQAGHDMTLTAIKVAKPIADCMDVSGLPQLRMTRALDPLLFEMNAAGAMNGHVPITGILSFAATAFALALDHDAVVFSNERSASEATGLYQGVAVNHQYSKSIEAERAMQDYLKRYVAADMRVFSFLRPLSEMQIAALFAEDGRYDEVFTSCNKAYVINRGINKQADARWCCDCDKCRFVFLALATAMEQERLVDIFGKNMLEDESQVEGFAALCGLHAMKPWECVGTVGEAAGAIGRLSRMEAWKDAAVVTALWGEAMTIENVDGFPADFLKALTNALRGHHD
jgi:UDP-N-acetyl-alpha-D-muramoyl-L-alanyl-L-glutamate epimerase